MNDYILNTMEITLSRVYNEQDDSDSFRILADRLWPRGIKKEALALDLWAKDIAPSTLLRQRYHQDNDYEAFKKDYSEELATNTAFAPFCEQLKAHKKITLLTASKVIDKSALPILMQAIKNYCCL